jgi:hypothetical protein
MASMALKIARYSKADMLTRPIDFILISTSLCFINAADSAQQAR